MSLPPGFLDELNSRISLAQVVGRKVTWDMRKSNQARGDWWAPCPFHQEKTASFHVDDRKGFYYCFGCQAKGDAITFVRETENVGFMEAVEILAREAGMQMPAPDPKAQERADRRSQLVEVMEQAVQFYRLGLRTAAAAPARDYLQRRGLDADTIERFELGYAPAGWQGLFDHLRGKGVAEELILAAGLARPSNSGRAPYDVFRDRIIFPIRDGRGRAIALGGRAMDPADPAKYLNSPETEIFDKGRTLYNLAPAREAAGRGQPLVVAEGYMDVIALARAGFEAAVAPLGTAITEHQLAGLWRLADEPVIALDGDAAGLRAAYRLIDLALPLLEAGRTLRFVLLPEGQDPDDLIGTGGAGAMRQAIGNAVPMVDLLWRRETEGRVFDSPERRAALDRRLREILLRIKDRSVRRHYGQALKDRRWQLFFRPAPRSKGGPRRGPGRQPAAPVPATKSSPLVAGDGMVERLRTGVILAVCLRTPAVIEEFASELEDLECTDSGHRAIRDALLRAETGEDGRLEDEIAERVGREALESLLSERHVSICPAVRRPGDVTLARLTVAEALARIAAERAAQREIVEAAEDLAHGGDESVTWRLAQAVKARERARSIGRENEEEFGAGDNGAPVSRREREAFEALVERIVYEKRRK